MMDQRCRQNGINVNRSTVALIQSHLDPVSVQCRKRNRLRRRKYYSRDPNYVWHIDGYDKLKPYGFPIHGAIDGFSRFILWLNVCKSNKDPKTPCTLFLNYADMVDGVPEKIVSDRGTENVYIAASQRFLRRSEGSFVYERYVSNQRNESWWSTNWWINFFRDIVNSGIYDLTDNVHVECAKFCFGILIQNDLEKIRESWNNHRIRRSINTNDQYRSSGIPSIIYSTPSILGNVVDYKHPLMQQEKDAVREVCCTTLENRFFCSENFYLLATIIMSENDLQNPNTVEEGLHLFDNLILLLNQI